MRTVYIADDGKEFNDEYECQNYEFKLRHPNIESIEIYDKDGNRLKDLFLERTYELAYRVIIKSKNEIKDINSLTRRMGYYGFNTINDTGIWIYDENDECFVRYSDRAFFKELSDKYVEKLKKYDSEANHEDADDDLMDLLTELGYEKVVEMYNKVPKWYS